MADTTESGVLESVKEYYGKVLKTKDDLKTGACQTPTSSMTKPVRQALADVHDEVAIKYYGCGLVIPSKLQGVRVLDLGSGSGRDCFAISKLVGQEGSVVGIDMTDEQLEVARKYIDYHTEKFGYKKPNTEFVKGFIEKLTEAGIPENSIDIIVSNCVVNLSPDKRAVLREAYKVLKVGGELYFSDVYSDRVVSEEARKDKVLWGECISGALYWKELYSLAKELGFSEPRLVAASPIPVEREDFKKILGDTRFVSVTYRLFKLPEQRESATQVIYNGEIEGEEKEFKLDHALVFKTGEVVSVDSEVATILKSSRLKDEFDFKPCGPGDKCCVKKVEVEVDPFQYLADLEAKGQAPAAACCGGSQKCC